MRPVNVAKAIGIALIVVLVRKCEVSGRIVLVTLAVSRIWGHPYYRYVRIAYRSRAVSEEENSDTSYFMNCFSTQKTPLLPRVQCFESETTKQHAAKPVYW